MPHVPPAAGRQPPNSYGVAVRDECVHDLIAKQASANPAATAVICSQRQLSYQELDHEATQLARHLQQHGVGLETLVGVVLESNCDTVVAILAILKAGGAYLPVDPTYPLARIELMFSDANPPVVITTAALAERQPPTAGHQRICVDTDQDVIRSARSVQTPTPANLNNLAYVIYTSGSTGTPKGVLLEHRGLRDMAVSHLRSFGVHRQSRVLQFAPLGFDASVSEIFMTLAAGATLCLPGRERLKPGRELVEVLREWEITNVLLPPSALAVMPDADLPRLETLIAGGERCTADLVQRWAPGREFFNAYGPTEGTVTATMWRCREDDAEDPPIGVPRDQAEVFILDDDLQPVPTGSCGELCLAGTGLARGYLNREELTKERFVFQAVDGPSVKRLYKTGDIGRLRTDGAVEFVGRRDRQVKVRGFRVEMNEVESCLRGHPQIAQAAVRQSANDGSHVRLLAFYVPEKDQSINVWQLRDWVGGKLPDYMIPAHFVSLDALTYDMNGKIDYEALLPLLNELPTSGTGRVPPRSRLEVVLSEIWCEVLGVDEVGIHDHFVELGGDSLVSVQIANQANERGLSLTSSQVFEHPTIAELAEFLES